LHINFARRLQQALTVCYYVMVFTGVRLSWVAFRLGAMINYEFSNLLHNEVTPSSPIKKKKRQRWCLLNNISQVFNLSVFVVVVVLQASFFFT